ncbi:MAG: methylenetetrahydrofolate reductase C-terminal domain-containing protein [Deltaproteobacteria bacterium]|nr:methylenetetrahydrofolate reductase C-terminal domain-containing protein [Deltaproteobacteria bacterium]MBW1793232.1 methylenetetrahydrofolate reductase C-terminal domain-containing protein [Deltaproteobacteria bacterium]MBW2329512.1 methylenetetrahydrofolate reductase C-terminal domain-containing protein [Deltaproteobacteria bacterium]
MIVATRKPFTEIKDLVSGHRKILIVGCGTCVSVCLAGGEIEVSILASQLRIALGLEGDDVQIDEAIVERQCNREFLVLLGKKKNMTDYDVIVSMACGAGVQLLGDVYDQKPVVPALNTVFIGIEEGPGIWAERCQSCGNCVLGETGDICPITMCPKGLLNGPCSGSRHGRCEVNPEIECAWVKIYDRLAARGDLERISKVLPPRKNSRRAHPAVATHEAYKRRFVKDEKIV